MGRNVVGVLTKFTVAACLGPVPLVFYDRGGRTAAEPIKIGVLTCLTGPLGFMGQAIQGGLFAIFDDIDQKGGIMGRKVELLLEDDQSNPSNAVIAATKLIKDEKVSMMIGASLADSDAAILPTIEQEQVPMLVAGPLVAPFKKEVFLLGPGDARGGRAHHGIRRYEAPCGEEIAILRDTTTYGSQGSKYYHQEIKKYPGVSIVIEEKMEVTDTNVIPQLTTSRRRSRTS